ncbi:Transmembrane protein 177 [Sergentomyia squamirostris]
MIIGKYFSDRARWAYRGCLTVTLATFAGYYLPHSIYLDKYKEFMTCYRDGAETTLPEVILQRFEAAREMVKLKKREANLLTPFATFGTDLFYAGSTKWRFGALIGIPTNYMYTQEEDIEKKSIKLHTESIKWNSPDGEKLAQSLILTEDEQIYGMAHSMLMTANYQRLLNGLFAGGTIMTTYTMAFVLNRRMQLLSRPFAIRGVLYSILSCFAFGLWALCKDATNVYYEGAADDQLGSLGENVAEAGVRFYGKILAKNQALREIMGKSGTYSTEGDLCYLIRQKTLPFTVRKAMLEQKVREFRKERAKTEE